MTTGKHGWKSLSLRQQKQHRTKISILKKLEKLAQKKRKKDVFLKSILSRVPPPQKKKNNE